MALILPLGCAAPPRPQHAYVWQRTWDDAVRAGVAQAAPVFDGLRVNAASVGQDGERLHAVDPSALGDEPVIAVVRIEATVAPDPARTGALLDHLAREWRGAGVALTGVEIDHDCPTRALPQYAAALSRIRGALDPSVGLSITALPTWATAPTEAAAVAASVDAVVLQVHTVDRGVLFDRARAEAAVRAWAPLTDRPLWVAVPAYGMAVGGRPTRVDPVELAGFVRALDRRIAGVVWFRLPVPGDRSTWSLPAIRAAIRGEVPRGAVRVSVSPGPAGAFDVALVGEGDVWAPAPPRIAFEGGCTAGDALPGWSFSPGGFTRIDPLPIDPGATVAVGWLRCERAPEVR